MKNVRLLASAPAANPVVVWEEDTRVPALVHAAEKEDALPTVVKETVTRVTAKAYVLIVAVREEVIARPVRVPVKDALPMVVWEEVAVLPFGFPPRKCSLQRYRRRLLRALSGSPPRRRTPWW